MLQLRCVIGADTMLVMGLKEEFAEARDWIDTNLKFTTDKVMHANNTHLCPGIDRHQPQVHYRQGNACQ